MKGDVIYRPSVNSSYESAFLMHLFRLVGIRSSLCPKKKKSQHCRGDLKGELLLERTWGWKLVSNALLSD